LNPEIENDAGKLYKLGKLIVIVFIMTYIQGTLRGPEERDDG
jgi:hypothetical protein